MREYFKNLPDKSTPLTAPRLNRMLNGEESIEKIVVGDIGCKNLFDINSGSTEVYNAIPTVINDTLKLVCNGGWSLIRYKNIPVEIGMAYTLSFNVSNPDENIVGVDVLKNDGSTLLGTVSITEKETTKQITFEATENEVIILLCANNTQDAKTNAVAFSNIQLEKGTSKTPYASHKKIGYNSIDSMGEIVVDDIGCKNLCDINTMVEGINAYRHFQQGILIILEGFNSLKMPVNPNTTYSFSTNSTAHSNLCFFDNSMNYISGQAFDEGNTLTTPNNCYYITMAVKNDYTWCQLEKGSIITKNTQFKKIGYNSINSMGEIVVDDISCKNLFNFDNMVMSYANIDYVNKTITFNGFNNATSNTLKDICPDLKVGETYTFSFKTTSEVNYIYLNGSQYSWWTGTPHTITQAELDDYILFYGTTGVDCVISDIQIEKGTVATNYTPYKSFEVREYIITGQEFPTNRYVDGKRVYGKRINIGSLPNSKSVTFATGIPSNYVIDDVNARAIGTDDDKSFLKMPFSTGIVYSAWVRNDAYVLEVSTTDDRSLLNGIFDFYYTKN